MTSPSVLSVFVIIADRGAYYVYEDRVYGPGQSTPPKGFTGTDDDMVFRSSWPLCAASTLESAREEIPSDRVRLARSPGDDPAVVEVWV